MKKLVIPGCYKVLDRRIKCGIALASYTEIEENEIKIGKFGSRDGVSAGLLLLRGFEKRRDLREVRRAVGSESIECACALYGGIVFMLEDEILSVYNEIPEGYGLLLSTQSKSTAELSCESQIELVRLGLALNLKKFSEVLGEQNVGVWEGKEEIIEKSIFWGRGEDGRDFALLPLSEPIEGFEVVGVDNTGMRMVESDD